MESCLQIGYRSISDSHWYQTVLQTTVGPLVSDHPKCQAKVVAYERWSLTRGSFCSDLVGEILVFWKSGRLREVVAYGRWSHREVQL